MTINAKGLRALADLAKKRYEQYIIKKYRSKVLRMMEKSANKGRLSKYFDGPHKLAVETMRDELIANGFTLRKKHINEGVFIREVIVVSWDDEQPAYHDERDF